MQLHIARQPIFNIHKQIVAYELLHREAANATAYSADDGNYATSSVITSAFLSYGLDVLTGDTMAYINFTSELLIQGVPLLLPRNQLVVEILEVVEPTEEVLCSCHAMKEAGYTLALDDFVLRPGYEPLVDLADIIKVDFRISNADEQRAIIERYRKRNLIFLAEKVETETEFAQAVRLGYSLFQGYFFARPVLLSSTAVPASKLGYVQLIQAIGEDAPDFAKIIRAIESDVSLSLDTIKLVNSAYYARRSKISSIKEAVVMLGLEGIRKWINLTAMTRLARNKPDVLVSQSLIRSKFMEQIACKSGCRSSASEYAMLGLFSLLDALVDCTFQCLLGNLNISDNIKNVLVGGNFSSHLGTAYQAMLSYERGDWKAAAGLCRQVNLTMDQLAEAYIDALEWHNHTAAVINKAVRQA